MAGGAAPGGEVVLETERLLLRPWRVGEAGVLRELGFELLRRFWRQGYATEASLAVLDWARSSGHERLWATVREWNTASRRVLAKVGFTETERTGLDSVYGDNLFATVRL